MPLLQLEARLAQPPDLLRCLSSERFLDARVAPLGLRERLAHPLQVPRRALRIDVHEARHDPRATLLSGRQPQLLVQSPALASALRHIGPRQRVKPNRDVAAPAHHDHNRDRRWRSHRQDDLLLKRMLRGELGESTAVSAL